MLSPKRFSPEIWEALNAAKFPFRDVRGNESMTPSHDELLAECVKLFPNQEWSLRRTTFADGRSCVTLCDGDPNRVGMIFHACSKGETNADLAQAWIWLKERKMMDGEGFGATLGTLLGELRRDVDELKREVDELKRTRQLPDAVSKPSEITIAPNVYDPMKVSTT